MKVVANGKTFIVVHTNEIQVIIKVDDDYVYVNRSMFTTLEDFAENY